MDPFDGGGASVRYAPGLDPPRLYSVGADGVDDGGDPRQHEVTRDDRDTVFSLSGESVERALHRRWQEAHDEEAGLPTTEPGP